MKNKRPQGEAWETFVSLWHSYDHAEKLRMCADLDVSYGTARHWLSDYGEAKPPALTAPSMKVSVPELLEMRPAVHLDFVCFDLESSNLKADFSILLAAAIKPYGREPIVFRADNYPEWKTDRANDSGITKDIADELRKHAIVVAHYGQKFDIPFLRAKMTKHRLEVLPPMFGIDSWRIAKNNFQVSSRRLQSLGHFFELGEKGGVDGALWMDAAYNGNREALDKIVEHNIIDVEILEKLACISFPFLKSIPKL